VSDRIEILSVALTEEGVELVVNDEAESRLGLHVAHSYFVEYESSSFGSRLRDAVAELQELAEDVHFGWKSEPKVASS
jgi:hypothetical protein